MNRWVLLFGAVLAFGCSASDDPRAAGAPIDFDAPPIEDPPPPANEATASTNTSSFPVSTLDAADCAYPTTGLWEFYQASSKLHFQTLDFNEGISNGYDYEFSVNLLVNEIPGKTVPLYRCLSGSHFVSSDPACEGATVESLLGYAYTSTSAQPAGTTPLYRFRSTSGDHYINSSSKPPSNSWSSEGLLGYTPTKACRTLSTTCQPFPSWYSGYSVNPGPDSDTGELVAYGTAAPAPPWFGGYQSAGDAILPGDWGTSNNVDWAPHSAKAECGYTDWMTGVSSSPGNGGALHAFRCAMSEFALSSRKFSAKTAAGVTCNYPDGDELGAAVARGSKLLRNRFLKDWDFAYYKYSCGPNQYLAGVSSDGKSGKYNNAMCCSQPGIGGDDCTTLFVGSPSGEVNTSMTTDDNGNASALDWDPPSQGKTYPKLECGAGRRMMGSSVDKNGALHAILCCRTSAPTPAQASTSCCSPRTLQTAVANCNADHLTFQSDCDNVVAPCCNSDPNSDGAGGVVCAKEAAALDPDASNHEGDPDSLGSGMTANAGPSCGSSGAALAWSYAYKKSENVGNKKFGAGYSGEISFGAGPIYANGEASVSAHASLFGKRVEIALVDLKGSITGDSPLTAEIKALGKDLYVYPAQDKKKNNNAGAPPPTTPTHTGTDWTWPKSSNPGKFDSNTLTYTQTFFTEKEVIFLFGVPVTITGTITGQLGIIASVDSAGDTLAFNATPWVGATATCDAALGGGKGAFKLTAGVEGALNLFTASLPTTATISPYTNHVNYTLNSDFTLAALDGKIDAYLKVRLKPFFKKKFKTTLTKWSGPTTTLHLFHHNGCMSY